MFEPLLDLSTKALFKFQHLYFCVIYFACTFTFSFETSTTKVLFQLCA
jgi:hypothetical protein